MLGIPQSQSAYLTCTRPWVQSLTLPKNKSKSQPSLPGRERVKLWEVCVVGPRTQPCQGPQCLSTCPLVQLCVITPGSTVCKKHIALSKLLWFLQQSLVHLIPLLLSVCLFYLYSLTTAVRVNPRSCARTEHTIMWVPEIQLSLWGWRQCLYMLSHLTRPIFTHTHTHTSYYLCSVCVHTCRQVCHCLYMEVRTVLFVCVCTYIDTYVSMCLYAWCLYVHM